MRYIVTNIKTFAKREKLIFILYILCIGMSALVINFIFGFYHHLKQKKMENMEELDGFDVEVNDPSQTTVTMKKVIEVLKTVDSTVMKKCAICLELRFQEDGTEDWGGLITEVVYFVLEDGELRNPPVTSDRLYQNGILKDGSYFTSEQFENGELVCLASAIDPESYEGEQEKWAKKYSENADGTCTVEGKTYQVIGHVEWFSCVPMVPATTLDGDESVRYIGFDFSEFGITQITQRQYEAIKEALVDAFGDKVEVPELEIADPDSQTFYSILILVCVLLGVFSGILLAMLYEYILLQRRKTLTIYRLCGLTRSRAVWLYILESLILTVAAYAASVVIYAKLILPRLSKSFEYIARSYSVNVYMAIGAIYTACVMAVLCVMIVTQIRKNIIRNLKGV